MHKLPKCSDALLNALFQPPVTPLLLSVQPSAPVTPATDSVQGPKVQGEREKAAIHSGKHAYGQKRNGASLDARQCPASLWPSVHTHPATLMTWRKPKGRRFCHFPNRQRSTCKECGGASICQHARRRSQCKECGGGSICQHNRERSKCKTCKADKDESMPPDLEELD